MRVLKPTLAALAALAALVFPAAALAAANHPFLHASESSYEDACGVALHSGLYVADYYHNAIDLPSGKISPQSTGSGPCKIETDAAGDLYVNDWHEKVVKYSSYELLPGHGTVIDSASPTGLWVEKASGDLYVAHRNYIAKYSAAGTLLEEIGNGSLEDAYAVAVSEFPTTLGDIYVPDAATKTVKVFDPSGALIGELDGVNTPQGHFLHFKDGEIAVDNSPTSPSYGHIYVLDAIGHGLSERPAAVIDEFNAAGDYRGQIAGFTDAEPSGIAIEGTAGPHNGNLYLTSGNSEGSQVFEYGPTAPAYTLEVQGEGTGAGTVTSSPVGVLCGAYCAAEFNEGQVVTLFATPDAHSAFTGWSVTGSEPCPGAGSCTVTMTDKVVVRADFSETAQEMLILNTSGEGTVTSSPEGISCPSACSEHFSQNRLVTLKAAPAPHHKLLSWSGCTVQSNPLECKVTMSGAEAAGATFVPIPQLSLGVTLGGGGQGTVTSYPPGLSCPGACSADFDEGSTVYLMAAPSPGSGFAGFAGAGCSGAAPLCAVAMASAQSLNATFTGTAAGPAGAAAAGSLVIGSVKTTAASAILTVKISEAGTLLTSGGGIVAAKRTLTPGTSVVGVRLGSRARGRLKRSGRLRLRLAIGFLPAAGGGATARSLALGFHATSDKALVPARQRRR